MFLSDFYNAVLVCFVQLAFEENITCRRCFRNVLLLASYLIKNRKASVSYKLVSKYARNLLLNELSEKMYADQILIRFSNKAHG